MIYNDAHAISLYDEQKAQAVLKRSEANSTLENISLIETQSREISRLNEVIQDQENDKKKLLTIIDEYKRQFGDYKITDNLHTGYGAKNWNVELIWNESTRYIYNTYKAFQEVCNTKTAKRVKVIWKDTETLPEISLILNKKTK